MQDRVGRFARTLTAASGSPYATVLAIGIIAAWAITGPLFSYSSGWQLVMDTLSSVVTFLMVFILNNAQLRDTRAINAKLDELIRSIEQADNRVIALEEKPAAEAENVLEAIKQAVEDLAEEAHASGSSPTISK